jgi:transcriptional regulator with XRE-family HTH domain
MSVAYHIVPEVGEEHLSLVKPFVPSRPLHRLKEVRRQEQVSRATVARRLKTTVPEVERQEDESSDMLLSTLYQWQEALDVPVSELLLESEQSLSTPVLRRAQLLRIMKTVMTILERSRQASIRRMAEMLAEQLTELMPELKGASPWPTVGKRRSRREVGQAARRCLGSGILRQLDEQS